MTAIDKLIECETKLIKHETDKAVIELKPLIQHRDPLIQRLTKELLVTDRSILYGALGSLTKYGYICWDTNPLSWLQFITQFIHYDILDDGDPGIAYTKYDMKLGSFVYCKSNARRAEPVFHQSLEMLRETYPDAKVLTPARALEIIEWHKKKDAEHQAYILEEFPEDIQSYKPDPAKEILKELIEELENDSITT